MLSSVIVAIATVAGALVGIDKIGTEAEIVPMISRQAVPVATAIPANLRAGGQYGRG